MDVVAHVLRAKVKANSAHVTRLLSRTTFKFSRDVVNYYPTYFRQFLYATQKASFEIIREVTSTSLRGK